jgi:acyl-[acyl-carrier-protein] desaturase
LSTDVAGRIGAALDGSLDCSAVDDSTLLHELTPVAESLLERHLNQTKEWFPHEYVPWERGPQVVVDRPWRPEDSSMAPAVRSALFVNLLTEDNLPYYLRDVQRLFGSDDVWGTWTCRWTAEEARHSVVIRDYLTLVNAIDPIELERGRMTQMSTAQVPDPPSTAHGVLYLSLQELATRISHHNTGKLIDDPAGQEVMKRVAFDENFHYLFYRDLATAAFDIDPSAMMCALESELVNFSMPGTGIPGFAAHSRAISKAGIYDFRVHHEQILVPVVLRHWGVGQRTGLDAPAERAQESIVSHIEKVGRVAARLAERAGEVNPDRS